MEDDAVRAFTNLDELGVVADTVERIALQADNDLPAWRQPQVFGNRAIFLADPVSGNPAQIRDLHIGAVRVTSLRRQRKAGGGNCEHAQYQTGTRH